MDAVEDARLLAVCGVMVPLARSMVSAGVAMGVVLVALALLMVSQLSVLLVMLTACVRWW